MTNKEIAECNSKDRNPIYVLMTEDYLLAKPEAYASSNRTQDIKFFDLAENYDLQCQLHLASSVFIRPINPFSTPTTGSALNESVARYLAAFRIENEKDQRHIFDYLMENGDLRILWRKQEYIKHQPENHIKAGDAYAI